MNIAKINNGYVNLLSYILIHKIQDRDKYVSSILLIKYYIYYVYGSLTWWTQKNNLFYLQIVIAIRRKRRLDRLRHSLIPFYSFDANEEEDWDSDLLQNEGGTPTIRVSWFHIK